MREWGSWQRMLNQPRPALIGMKLSSLVEIGLEMSTLGVWALRYHQVRQEMGFFRVLSVMSGSQRRCNEIQKSYYDFIYFSNHSLKSFADLTGAQFKSFRNCHLLYKGRIVKVHTKIRINEITRNTSPNHSTMHGKLSHLPFNRVRDAKSTEQVYKFSSAVNMTYASIGSRYV